MDVNKNMENFVKKYNSEFIETLKKMDHDLIYKLYKKIEATILERKAVYILGNGGSSASASHWVCDFNKGINHNASTRGRFYALSDNTPLITAIGNDISYDDIFKEQLKNYLEPNDLVIGLSVSGNSKNIIKALEYSQKKGAQTFSIIGDYEGAMENYSDSCLIVQSKNYGIVEDVHMNICHIISQYMNKMNKATF